MQTIFLRFQKQDALKFIYSEKATKFCEIFPLLLIIVHTVKSKGKILQNFVAFSEYMNFNACASISRDIWSNTYTTEDC